MEVFRNRPASSKAPRSVLLFLSAALLWGCADGTDGGGATEDVAVPGDPAAGVATARCIGLRWEIAEDANVNAVVEAYYRKLGAGAWTRAMDLMRIQRAPFERHGPRREHLRSRRRYRL